MVIAMRVLAAAVFAAAMTCGWFWWRRISDGDASSTAAYVVLAVIYSVVNGIAAATVVGVIALLRSRSQKYASGVGEAEAKPFIKQEIPYWGSNFRD